MGLRGRVAVAALVVAVLGCCSTGDDQEAVATTTSTAPAPSRQTTTSPRSNDDPGTIVFEAGAGRLERLVALDRRSGQTRDVTEGAGFGPRLSPDGSLLAYSAQTENNPEGDSYVVHIASMRDGATRSLAAGGCPSWTRDGTAVLIGTDEGLRRVTTEGDSTPIPGSRGSDCAAEIAADRYVLWTQGPDMDLLANGRRSRLVTRPGCGIGPVSPDPSGSRLALTITCPGNDSGLFVMDLESRRMRRLIAGNSYGAAWSPDGSGIVTAHRPPGGQFELWWVCDCDSPAPEQLGGGGPANNPTWGRTAT